MTAPIAAIVEPAAGGHRFAYVRLLAEAAMAKRLQPVLVTDPANVTTREFGVHLARMVQTGELLVTAPPYVVATDLGLLRVRSAMTAVDEFVRAGIGVASPRALSRVIFPEGDGQLVALAAIGRAHGSKASTSALVMRRPRPDPRRPRSIPRAVAKAQAITVARIAGIRVFTLAPAGTDTRDQPWSVADPVDVVRPSTSRSKVRVELGLPRDASLVGVFGSIDARKNLSVVARAVRVSSVRPACRLVVVGSVDPEILAAISAMPETEQPMRIVDDYVDNELLDAYIYCMDVVVAAHSNDAPSGVVARAMALGTRAVVAGSPTLQKMAETSDLIESCGLDAQSLAVAISRSCSGPHPNLRYPANNDLTKMLQ